MTQKSICAVCSDQQANNKWLPRSIDDYREHVLIRYVGQHTEDSRSLFSVFSNIAYNLQYLEYLNKCFEELYLTSVIRAQNVKMFLLTTSQIIECFLYIKLVEMGVDKNEIWDFVNNLRTANAKNAFGLGSNFYRNEMKWMKELRNHIHIQSPAAIAEADYAIFESIDVLNRSKSILVYFLQRALTMQSSEMHEIFYFLEPTADFVHAKNAQTSKEAAA